ncbi:MAG: hypothetical protein WKG32_15825 [Gemmatimonadaceae bacterium]
MLGGGPRAGGGLAAQGSGARSHVLIIAGIAGEPKFVATFHRAALALADAAKRSGVPDSSILYLADDTARAAARVAGRSTKEGVERAVGTLAGRAKAGDQVFIVLIGHGSAQGGQARFNLPGPDITATDFAALLKRFPTQRVALVNAASASGDFIAALSGANRAIVTATKTGFESNETIFPRFFADAFAGGGADVDKDGRVSLLEAFTYARREVARAYEEEGRLLTEHALLDDNGDHVGSAEPGPRGADGSLARTMFFSAGTGGASSSDPRVAALARDKDAAEARVDSLRRRKSTMDAAAYDRELERLLLDLATKSQALRAAEGKKP